MNTWIHLQKHQGEWMRTSQIRDFYELLIGLDLISTIFSFPYDSHFLVLLSVLSYFLHLILSLQISFCTIFDLWFPSLLTNFTLGKYLQNFHSLARITFKYFFFFSCVSLYMFLAFIHLGILWVFEQWHTFSGAGGGIKWKAQSSCSWS